MQNPIAIIFTLAAISSAALSAPVPVLAHGFGFEIPGQYFQEKYNAKVEPRYTAKENGNEIPFGIGPKRVRFSLAQKPPAFSRNLPAWKEFEAWMAVIPLQDSTVSNFDEAYPPLATCRKELSRILKTGTVAIAPCNNLPTWDFLDAMQMVHAHAGIVNTPWCNGIQYLTQEVQEACPIDDGRLVYRFIGISKDGKYLLDFCSLVSSPSLPFVARGIESAPEQVVKAYCAKAEKALNNIPRDSFFPQLSKLEGIVKSFMQK